jgi:hypothetical protein
MKRFSWLTAGCAALACGALLAPAVANATKSVDLRVLTATQDLAQVTQYTGTTNVPTDPGADCFGPPGGSGDPIHLQGATALGVVGQAAETVDDLQPLSITDQFDFGPGICEIGGLNAPLGFWYLKVNHVGSTVGGGQQLDAGDQALWYLDADFSDPPPGELALRAPASASASQPFTVRVVSFADDGTRSPAAGAVVPGGSGPTDADGETTVTAPNDVDLQATRAGDIPSNTLHVCVAIDSGECPDAHGSLILGTDRAEDIRGTRGPDAIRARGGDDVIDIGSGGADRVSCGAGDDIVERTAGVRDDTIDKSCERVVRR